MPLIRIATAKPLSEEQQDLLKQELGRTISVIPEKAEDNTMIEISLGQTIYFRGVRKESAAFVEVKLFTKAPREAMEAFAGHIFSALEKIAGIAPEDVYMNYLAYDNWGLRGKLFFG